MSRSTSPSANKPYGLARVCRVWKIPRATACRHRNASDAPPPSNAKCGPRNALSDDHRTVPAHDPRYSAFA